MGNITIFHRVNHHFYQVDHHLPWVDQVFRHVQQFWAGALGEERILDRRSALLGVLDLFWFEGIPRWGDKPSRKVDGTWLKWIEPAKMWWFYNIFSSAQLGCKQRFWCFGSTKIWWLNQETLGLLLAVLVERLKLCIVFCPCILECTWYDEHVCLDIFGKNVFYPCLNQAISCPALRKWPDVRSNKGKKKLSGDLNHGGIVPHTGHAMISCKEGPPACHA